jgi:hypothetical protein
MTKRDIFIILLKCFGLYLIFISLYSTVIYNIFQLFNESEGGSGMGVLVGNVFVLILFYLLFVNTSVLSGWLRLDRGFDSDEIALDKIKSESLVKLVVLALSAYLVVSSVPGLLSKLLFSLSDEIVDQEMGRFEKIGIFEMIIQFVGGILIFTNFRSVSDWLYARTISKEIIDQEA